MNTNKVQTIATGFMASVNRKNLRACIIFLFLIVFGLAACSQAVEPMLKERVEIEAEEVGDFDQAPGVDEGLAISEPEEVAAEPPTESNALISFQPAEDRMVIKDAMIDLLVKDTERAISQVTQLAAEQGGYIIDARSWYEGQYKYAELKLGVPVATFEHTLNVLRDLGIQVNNETVSGQDVSSQYNDLQSRLTNLEATAERVRSFLEDAKTIDEALTINQTLSQLEAQIEEVKGQMRYYEGRSAFSTVTVRLNPEVILPTPTPTPTPAPPPGWDPGKTFRQASSITVRNMQHFIDSLIWFVVIYWPVILIAIAGILVIRYYRRRIDRKTVPAAPSWQKKDAATPVDETTIEAAEDEVEQQE